MPNRFIYAREEGRVDHSRWLSIEAGSGGTVAFDLSELCHPGRVSTLSNIVIPEAFLRSALTNGALQFTTPTGYFLLRSCDNSVSVEFRTLEDISVCRATLATAEILNRLDELSSNRASLK